MVTNSNDSVSYDFISFTMTKEPENNVLNFIFKICTESSGRHCNCNLSKQGDVSQGQIINDFSYVFNFCV